MTFTSSITDTSTGLQYMNARYYEPTTGRFISQDTYTGNAYDPWTQHLYSYCGNNPTNFIDPTGHKATSWNLYMQAEQFYNNVYKPLDMRSSDLMDLSLYCYNEGFETMGNILRRQSIAISKLADRAFSVYGMMLRAAVAAEEAEEAERKTIFHLPRNTYPSEPPDEDKWVMMIGSEVMAEAGGRTSYAYQYAWDSEGNYGIVDTTGAGLGTLAASASAKYTRIFGYDLTQLRGFSASASGSVGFIVGGGVEAIFINGEYAGWSLNAGASANPKFCEGGIEKNWSEVEILGNAGTPDIAFAAAIANANTLLMSAEDKQAMNDIFNFIGE